MIYLAIILGVILLVATYQTGRDLGDTAGYRRGRRDGGRVGYLQGRRDERAAICADPSGTIDPTEAEIPLADAYHEGGEA